jgi:two-component system phosphate regulon sensor histidine kinase PhoR
MKLEKVASRPKVGLWVFLFILGLTVAGVMATSYNVEIVARVQSEVWRNGVRDIPWAKIVLGSSGFVGIIIALVLFFARLLREMKVSQMQADFLDRISHELRTPLSTLTLLTDLLKNPDPATNLEHLWKSHDLELERLKNDVELLLQAARLRESKLRPDLHTVDFEQWISDHWASFEILLGPTAEFKRTGKAMKGEISIDLSLFEMIVRNLLDNARKFSMQRPVVGFHTSRKGNKWRLSISDQGLGFSPENQGFLFRRFSRLPFARPDLKPVSIPGTGLGLYLSATASKAMGLTLMGYSQGEGKGAVFVLEGRFK